MAIDDEGALRALIEARIAAIYAGDVGRAVGPMADDVVVYDLQPPLALVGAPARDAEAIAQWLTTWDGPVRIEMPDATVRVDGDLALAHGLSRMTGTKRGSGRSVLWYRSTLCLRRREGAWSIIHEHHSVPMKMDGSGLAAIDLVPESSL